MQVERRYKTLDLAGRFDDGIRAGETPGIPKDFHLSYCVPDTMTVPADDCRF